MKIAPHTGHKETPKSPEWLVHSQNPGAGSQREVATNVEIRLSSHWRALPPRGIVVRSSHFLPPLVIGGSISLSCLERGMWFTINRTPV